MSLINRMTFLCNQFRVSRSAREQRAELSESLDAIRDVQTDMMCFDKKNALFLGSSLPHAIGIIKSQVDIRGKRILLIGCGHGQEIHTWMKEQPARLLALDYLDYSEDWSKIKYPEVEIRQADIRTSVFHEQFDLIASAAVLEHIVDFETNFAKIISPLANGGFFWAGFGPLYHTWGGSHAPFAYDHLTKSREEFLAEIKSHCAEDEWTFNLESLFSKMTLRQYLDAFQRHLEQKYLGLEFSEEALRFREERPAEFSILKKQFSEFDLILKSVYYLGRKK